jgi:hypothetical protein
MKKARSAGLSVRARKAGTWTGRAQAGVASALTFAARRLL